MDASSALSVLSAMVIENHLFLTIANDLHLDRFADPECRDHHQKIMRVLDLFAVDFDHDIA